LRADGDSQLVLFKNNEVVDAWNSVDKDTAASMDLEKEYGVVGLIHSVYIGYVRDVIFLNNTFLNASGPLFKFGYYPAFHGGILPDAEQYPHQYSWQRRVFLLNNRFRQDKATYSKPSEPAAASFMSFIHENSVAIGKDGKPTAEAQGVVIIGNDFQFAGPKSEAGGVLDRMAFLRQELPKKCASPAFKDWRIEGNAIRGGVWYLPGADATPRDGHPLFYARARGSSTYPAPAYPDPDCHGSDLPPADLAADLQAQAKPGATPLGLKATADTVANLLCGDLKSDDPARDRLIVDAVRLDGLPGLDAGERSGGGRR
jgi:hypothetical protein